MYRLSSILFFIFLYFKIPSKISVLKIASDVIVPYNIRTTLNILQTQFNSLFSSLVTRHCMIKKTTNSWTVASIFSSRIFCFDRFTTTSPPTTYTLVSLIVYTHRRNHHRIHKSDHPLLTSIYFLICAHHVHKNKINYINLTPKTISCMRSNSIRFNLLHIYIIYPII